MSKDIIGSMFGFLLLYLMLVITPIYYIGIIQWARSENQAMSYVQELVDEVIDTRVLTEDTLADFNLNMASLSDYYTVTIERQVKVINPDPLNSGSTYTVYMNVDNIMEYDQGDLILVTITPIGNNMFQTISRSLLGLSISSEGYTIPGRVR